MKRRTKVILGVGCLVPLIVVGAFALVIFLGPPGPTFTCHRGLDSAFEQWKMATTNGSWYPNIGGIGKDSLEAVSVYVYKGMASLQDYRYVPGLKSDDPKELILMYVNRPSIRTWHGDTHWFRREKRWVILNPQTSSPDDTYGSGWSECGEALRTPEFKRRLQATLGFLKENNRPFWTNVVNEHSAFLKSIEE